MSTGVVHALPTLPVMRVKSKLRPTYQAMRSVRAGQKDRFLPASCWHEAYHAWRGNIVLGE